MTSMCWNMDSIILVARSLNGISKAMRMRILLAVLFEFKSEEVICSDSVEDVFSAAGFSGFDNGSDVRCVGVDFAT